MMIHDTTETQSITIDYALRRRPAVFAYMDTSARAPSPTEKPRSVRLVLEMPRETSFAVDVTHADQDLRPARMLSEADWWNGQCDNDPSREAFPDSPAPRRMPMPVTSSCFTCLSPAVNRRKSAGLRKWSSRSPQTRCCTSKSTKRDFSIPLVL